MSKDLIILVADLDMENTLHGLFARDYFFNSHNIREIEYKIIRHLEKDPGVYNDPVSVLRPYLRDYSYAMVFLDHEGSGQESTSGSEVCEHIKNLLERNGWTDKVEVIAFEPELEIWLWTDSLQVIQAINWQRERRGKKKWGSYTELKHYGIDNGYWNEGEDKPGRPKELFEKALEITGKPYSSALYKEIANKVSLTRCIDPNFDKFKATLQRWFAS